MKWRRTVPSALRSSLQVLNDWTDSGPALPSTTSLPAADKLCSVHCIKIWAPINLLSNASDRSSSVLTPKSTADGIYRPIPFDVIGL